MMCASLPRAPKGMKRFPGRKLALVVVAVLAAAFGVSRAISYSAEPPAPHHKLIFTYGLRDRLVSNYFNAGDNLLLEGNGS